ncbi:hypothetical protein ACEZDB_18950 [Streptacidiphilus sp. N1-3]|uniref:STAS domain-containing protein n=1 Tax=Streptacidiphilus alkalitolerans TaxID=3342712 RepID=A0ABV6X362_9ACTN
MTYQGRRMLHLHPADPGQVRASIHGVVDADAAQNIADTVAGLVAADTREVHLDVDQANALSAAAAAILLFALLRAARTRDPAAAVTVHRADSRTRAHMRELGLDRLIAHSDHPL